MRGDWMDEARQYDREDQYANAMCQAAERSGIDAALGPQHRWAIVAVCREAGRPLPVSHSDLVEWAQFCRRWGFVTNVDPPAMPEVWREVDDLAERLNGAEDS